MALQTILLVFLILVNSNIVRMDLIVDKRCGQLSCDRHMYCSQIDRICKDCANICQRDHNYNSEACSQGCEDYLHDITYVRRDDVEGTPNSLKEEVNQLRTTLIATLTLVVLMLVGIVIVLSVQALKWCRNNKILINKFKNLFHRKKSEVTSADAKTISNPNAHLGDDAKHIDLRLNISSTRVHSDLPTPATLSTNISRRPAEDSMLDYAAYDNPAMNRSGSNHEDSPCPVVGISRDRTY